MKMSLCGAGMMMQMRSMHGMGYSRSRHTPDNNEFTNRMIQEGDKNGSTVQSVDGFGKMLSSREGKMMPMSGMSGLRNMYGMGCMYRMPAPDANEFANPINQKYDEDGNGALSADELGKFSEKLGLGKDDFNEDGLIDHEKLISKILEIVEERGKESADVNDGLESPVLSVDAVEVDSGNPVFRNSSDEDLPLPNHPPIEQIPPIPMPTPEEVYPENVGPIDEDLPLPDHPPIEQIPPVPMPTPEEAYPEDAGTLNDFDTQPADVTTGTQSPASLVKKLLNQLNLSEEKIASFLKTMQNYGINVTV